MKSTNKKITFACVALLATTLLSSCEKVIEPKNLPEQDPRLVINSIISTDSVITANVSVSKSIVSGKEYKFLNDATCELYINDRFAERMKIVKDGNYVATNKGAVGSNYKVKVIANGYTDAEGSSSMPEAMVVKRSERYDTLNFAFRKFVPPGQPNFSNYYASLKYKVYVRDNPSQPDFFSIQPLVVLLDSLGDPLTYTVPAFLSSNQTGGFEDQAYWSGNSLEVNDTRLVNGDEVLVDATLSFNFSPIGGQSVYAAEIFLISFAAGEDYYKYKVTLGKQQANSTGLFAEPVMVHNNIRNGLGIVGCRNAKLISLGRVKVLTQ